jgi:hypothetical protein
MFVYEVILSLASLPSPPNANSSAFTDDVSNARSPGFGAPSQTSGGGSASAVQKVPSPRQPADAMTAVGHRGGVMKDGKAGNGRGSEFDDDDNDEYSEEETEEYSEEDKGSYDDDEDDDEEDEEDEEALVDERGDVDGNVVDEEDDGTMDEFEMVEDYIHRGSGSGKSPAVARSLNVTTSSNMINKNTSALSPSSKSTGSPIPLPSPSLSSMGKSISSSSASHPANASSSNASEALQQHPLPSHFLENLKSVCAQTAVLIVGDLNVEAGTAEFQANVLNLFSASGVSGHSKTGNGIGSGVVAGRLHDYFADESVIPMSPTSTNGPSLRSNTKRKQKAPMVSVDPSGAVRGRVDHVLGLNSLFVQVMETETSGGGDGGGGNRLEVVEFMKLKKVEMDEEELDDDEEGLSDKDQDGDGVEDDEEEDDMEAFVAMMSGHRPVVGWFCPA